MRWLGRLTALVLVFSDATPPRTAMVALSSHPGGHRTTSPRASRTEAETRRCLDRSEEFRCLRAFAACEEQRPLVARSQDCQPDPRELASPLAGVHLTARRTLAGLAPWGRREICLCADPCGLHLEEEPIELIRASARWVACPAASARIAAALDACAELGQPVEFYGPECESARPRQ